MKNNALPYLSLILGITFILCPLMANKLIVTPFGFIQSGIFYGVAGDCLIDIIAEVYGIFIARRLCWFGFICETLSFLLCDYLIRLPSPDFFSGQNAFNFIFNHKELGAFFQIISFVIYVKANTYFMNKWRILFNGRYFWMRSVGSSIIGDFFYRLTLTPLFYYSGLFVVSTPHEALIRGINSFIFANILLALFAFPSTIIMNILKAVEGWEEPAITKKIPKLR